LGAIEKQVVVILTESATHQGVRWIEIYDPLL